jgi:hypothetical protein
MGGETSIRTGRLALSVAVWGLLFLGLTTTAQAVGSFSVRPAQSNPAEPVTRAYFKPLAKPGASFSQAVIVSNNGSSTVHLLVYAVDGLTGQTTGTVYGDRGDRVRKAGLWVRAGISQISVPAGREVSVPFTVRVPRRAKPGDHVAGIAFQDATQHTSSGSFRITEIFREVIGIQIRVPGRAFPRLALGGVQLRALPGTPLASVVVVLGNRGLKLCKPRLAVSLRGPHGYHGRVVRVLDTVLPGDTVDYPLPWPGRLRHGSYAASAIASCQGHRVARVATVQLGKSLGVVVASPRAGSTRRGAVPAWVFVLVALAGLGIGVVLTHMRMARRHRAALAAAGGQNHNQLPATTSAGHPPTIA